MDPRTAKLNDLAAIIHALTNQKKRLDDAEAYERTLAQMTVEAEQLRQAIRWRGHEPVA